MEEAATKATAPLPGVAPVNAARMAAANVYEGINSSDDYRRNDASLKLIQFCVVTVSALATGFVNSFAHKERIGWLAAGVLAILIMGFVEKFFFTLRHGLTTTYKAGKQRTYAQLCCRTIQATMILNAAVLCAWIVNTPLPRELGWWYRWSIAVHVALALVGVTLVRDADAVVENRMLELKAATARQDIITTRKAAAIGNAMVLVSAKVRGFFDAFGLAWGLLWKKDSFAKNTLAQLDAIAREQFAHIDGPAARRGEVWPDDLGEVSGPKERCR
ncbi:MAG: hypothetical protein HY011_08750 [Acidobacteria bacterium]|nr:hypothetical protein [Acidobacteriota bacterium]